jgi:hypothetical protein
VASSEESLKVAVINALAVILGVNGVASKIEKLIIAGLSSIGLTAGLAALETTLLGAAGSAGIGFWVFLHTFQSIQSTSGLFMATCAGVILLTLVVYFRNILPAIALHAAWNCLTVYLTSVLV